MRYSDGGRIALAVKIKLKTEPEGLLPLYDFVLAVRKGHAPDHATLEIIAQRFDGILQGQSPDKALKLRPSRGRPRSFKSLWRNLTIAIEVRQLVESGELRDIAIQKVAKQCHKSFGTIEAAYYEHEHGTKQILAARARILEKNARRS
jgi:hypothetical protein